MANPLWPETLRRLDVVLFRLQRDHYWARRTLRNLRPVETQVGSIAVNPALRLRVNPEFVAVLTDAQLKAIVWHEVNHILRHHTDRFEVLVGKDKDKKRLANMAADVEINGELLAQGFALPEFVLTPQNQNLPEGETAEAHYQTYLVRADEQQRGGGGDGDPDPNAPVEPGFGPPVPGKGEQQKDQRQDQRSNGDQSSADEGSDEGSGGGSDKGQGDSEQFQGCGSGGGGEEHPDDANDPTDPDEQARVDRENRRQADEIIAEVASHGFSDVSEAVYRAALEVTGPSIVDWRKEMAYQIRRAVEQVSDEAEEYTFKRRSRRQPAVGEQVILPGSHRPVPALAIVADVSGSMDFEKLQQVANEMYGVLNRLAIPSYRAFPFDARNRGPVDGYLVQTRSDISKAFDIDAGGGTNMLAGIDYAIEHGAEVVLVLTDLDCRWQPWDFEVPVIVGGIRAGENAKARLPKGVPYVDVKEANE